MKITILTGNDELNFALDRYLRFIFRQEVSEILSARLGHPETLAPSMLSANLWIIEAFNPDNPENPEGFRTAKKLAGTRCLIIFTYSICSELPKVGEFWLTVPFERSISSVIENLMKRPAPTNEDFDRLEKICKILKKEPLNHHHEK